MPLSCVQKRTSWSSTAKWTMHRPNWKSSSRASRSLLYCSTASPTVCFVSLFFSSKVATAWKEILTPRGLTEIIENYAQIVEKKNEKTAKIERKQIFPRYHQLDVVRKLLSAAQAEEAGRRYLIQHSAGSGKSNSIACASQPSSV